MAQKIERKVERFYSIAFLNQGKGKKFVENVYKIVDLERQVGKELV